MSVDRRLSFKSLLLTFLLSSADYVQSYRGSCSLDKAVEDVAVTVGSEVASILLENQPTLRGPERCRPRDCADVQVSGKNSSGVYRIYPRTGDSCGINVYCDLENHGGGWTVIQKRGDFGKPVDYFYKSWRDYKFGFGNLSEDFWLGNDQIFQITNQENYMLRVDLATGEGESSHAIYEEFYIESESSNYTLHVSGYTGDAGDSLTVHSGHQFTTKDKDNDSSGKNCAEKYKGAWWYGACYHSNLNGQYLKSGLADGVVWNHWKGNLHSIKYVTMKIRLKWFQ